MKLTFEQICEARETLNVVAKVYSDKLQAFPRGPMGLTPDHIKATDEWKTAYYGYQETMKKLRKIGTYINKNFKKEQRELVRKRRAERLDAPELHVDVFFYGGA